MGLNEDASAAVALRTPATETAPSRVSGGKAAEIQRLFRRLGNGSCAGAQDCVVELGGLEPAIERL
jgi:hypothetical protein